MASTAPTPLEPERVPAPARALARAMRPHQWAKNLLVAVPALAAHRVPTPDTLAGLGLAFAALSLLASSVYLLNDVADVEEDRAHPRKRHRPVAAGTLGAGTALAASAVLAALAFALAWQLPPAFRWTLAVYLAVTGAYSMGLKRAVVLDVLVLGALYTIRVIAGAAAVDVPLSRWFLAFSVFVFTSLALLKRAAEAVDAEARGAPPGLPGRGWRSGDLPVLLAFGAASSAAAALVYCLYITGQDVLRLYGRPDLLWLGLPVILYWLARAWVLALRGDLHEDPVLFALRDPASWAALVVSAAMLWMAA